MSNLPAEEFSEVEQVVEPVAVGLPRALQALNRQQMADFIIAALRKPKDETPVPEQPSSDGK